MKNEPTVESHSSHMTAAMCDSESHGGNLTFHDAHQRQAEQS